MHATKNKYLIILMSIYSFSIFPVMADDSEVFPLKCAAEKVPLDPVLGRIFCQAMVDQIVVKKFTINRGNCPDLTSKYDGTYAGTLVKQKFKGSIKYGNEASVLTSGECSIVSLEVESNLGSYVINFK